MKKDIFHWIKVFILFAVTSILIGCGGSGSNNSSEIASNKLTLSVDRFGKGVIADETNGFKCDQATCSNAYDENQKVTLTTTPESGWRLHHWEGCDEVNADRCVVTMLKNKTVYPTFERTTEPKIHSNVMVLDNDLLSKIISMHDGAIIFSSDAIAVASVSQGTILISNEGEGFARKVTDVVALADSGIIVATTNVPLEEIISEGTIIYNTQLTTSDLLKVSSVEGIQYIEKESRSSEFNFEIDVEPKPGIHIKGGLALEIVPDFAIDLGWTGLEEFKTAAKFIAKPTITVSYEKDIKAENDFYLDLPTMKIPIQVGIVTIVQEIKGKLHIGAETGIEVSMSGGLNVTTRAGAHYIKSVGWKGIGEFDISGDFDPLSIKGKAKIGTMVGPEYSTKIYGVVGPKIFVGPYVEGESEFDATTQCGEWLIKIGARATASIEGKVLGWKLESANLKLIDYGIKLAGDEFGECDSNEVPSAPVTPVISQSLSTSLTIDWTKPTSDNLIEYYEVYRDHKKITEVSSTTYIDNLLSENTEYCYYVIAVDNKGNKSSESSAVCGFTSKAIDNEAPTVPSNITATAASSSAIDLKWNPATDNESDVSYVIFKADTEEIIDGVDTAMASITRLKANTEYCFQVAALDGAGNISELTGSVCATTKVTGKYNMLVKCEDMTDYAVNTTMDLDETVNSNVSVIGNAFDYSGTPMTYVLTGNYSSTSHTLDGRIDWSFEGSDCVRADTFVANIESDDTNDVTMNQVNVCGCTAQIRFIRGSEVSQSNDSSTLKTYNNVGATISKMK